MMFVLLFFGVGTAQVGFAGLSDSKHTHHFFNARLLDEGEAQVSIVGNVKAGVSENYQLGTQGMLSLAGLYNISAKHRMFRGEGFETSMVTHIFSLTGDSASGTSASEADDEGSTSRNALMFLAPTGIITTSRVAPSTYLNWGLYDYFLYQNIRTLDFQLSLHLLSAVLGVDQYLSPHWSFGATLSYGAFVFGGIDSDAVDFELSANLLTGLPPDYNPRIGFATFTYHGDGAFSAEMGAMLLGTSAFPYINMFWRMH